MLTDRTRRALRAGFDPDSSTNVVLENSVINAGDDCVAIYSVRGPTRNVLVRNVTCHTPLSITHGNYGKAYCDCSAFNARQTDSVRW